MWSFILAATALLGSPGPAIAALLAVGRAFPRQTALRFYLMLQIGLAIAAGLSATGLAALLRAVPSLETGLMVVATIYLIWLAWTIASAPLAGQAGQSERQRFSARGAFLLGIANPKAYLAFASLFGSFSLAPAGAPWLDAAIKWGMCVIVMVIVDLAWLLVGMAFGRAPLGPKGERMFNITMGLAIVAAAAGTWWSARP